MLENPNDWGSGEKGCPFSTSPDSSGIAAFVGWRGLWWAAAMRTDSGPFCCDEGLNFRS